MNTSKILPIFDSFKTESFDSARNSGEFRHNQKSKRGLMISDKRGQIYLIAAIIIIFIIIGFYMARNYVTTESNTKIYDLSNELKLETGSVYDYGIYKAQNLNLLLNNWTNQYYEYSKENKIEDWIFIYGNNNSMKAATFSSISQGSVGVVVGGQTINVDITKNVSNITDIPISNQAKEVKVRFKNVDHDFNLNSGENFFFVIKSGGYTARN